MKYSVNDSLPYGLREVCEGYAIVKDSLSIVKATCYEYDDYTNPIKLIWYKRTGNELDPNKCKLFGSYEAARDYALDSWTKEVKRLLNAIENLALPKSEIGPETA